MTKTQLLTAAACVLALASCKPSATTADTAAADNMISDAPTETPPAPSPAAPPAAEPATTKPVLTLDGLGDLKIGEPVPAGSSFAERGAQASDACRTVSSPAYPGVYAIVEGGKVRRISVGPRSDVTLTEGIGVGASEKDVKGWFAGFRETPHKYVEAPAKYLTAPNAVPGEKALRFEIGQDGKVALIHVGTMPQLGYVEGCS